MIYFVFIDLVKCIVKTFCPIPVVYCCMSDILYSTRITELERILPQSFGLISKISLKANIICNVYRPPNSAVELWERLNICLDKASKICDSIILVVDITEHPLNCNNHRFRDILFLNNMDNTINEPTRVYNNSSTLLDPISITKT